MSIFGELKRVPLRDAWRHEATDFTPWLADNVEALGKSLGLELELTEQEASVGDFSLDLLAQDLGSSRTVIIENQLTQTDHDHLGKLLTYAAGFDASIVIWVAEVVREEHRQALEWLNQRTDTTTRFFAVVVDVLQIDDSKPAFTFRAVVFPNEWQKSKKQRAVNKSSPKAESYRSYFQALIDILREQHRFTNAKAGQPQNWYSFSSGLRGVKFSAVFCRDGKVRSEIYIDLEDEDKNLQLFDALESQKEVLEQAMGKALAWERLDSARACRIAVYRYGSIEASDSELEEIRSWHVHELLNIKRVFSPAIKLALKRVTQQIATGDV